MSRQPQRLADLLPAVIADLANRHHATNGEPPAMTEPTKQHSREDRCFFCATDAELLRGLHGDLPRTIHMQTPPQACPFEDVAEEGPRDRAV